MLFQAQTKQSEQSEYVKSFESDYGICSTYQHTDGTVIADCTECVLESLRDSAKK